MKTCKQYFTCILFFVFCFFCNKNYGQTYFPLVQDSVKWCIWNYYGDINIGHERILSYELTNDTLIDGLVYKNILITQRYYALCCYMGYSFDVNVEDQVLGYAGALREDGGKVYFYQYPETAINLECPFETDLLLYDFSLEVGESAYFPYVNTPGYYHIEYVDSILLSDGLYHKTLFIDIDGGKEWIEGVGDKEKGLFGTYLFDILGGDNYDYFDSPLFMKNEMVLYPAEGGDCRLGGVNAVTDISQFYHLYFNSHHELILNLPETSEEYKILIYDLTSEKVFSSAVKAQDQIDLHLLSSGIYLATVQMNGRTVYTQKFVSVN